MEASTQLFCRQYRSKLPSVLWNCWLGIRKSIRPVTIVWWGVDVIICLEQGADCLHMVQLMWLHASFKSRLILPFWYPLTLDVLEKRLLNGCCSSNSNQAALHTWSAKMQPFATYVARSVWLSVCLFTYASVCCTQQWVLFGLRTHVGPKNHVIGEGLDPKEMDNFTGCFPTGMHCNVMSMWSLRWHFTNKSVTGAPYSIKGYSCHTAEHYGEEYDDWNSAILRSRRNCSKLDYESSKCHSSTGLQSCLQETVHHGQYAASKQSHPPRGWLTYKVLTWE